jgi:amino acid transporter
VHANKSTVTTHPTLRRSLGLTLLTLYGVGITVGAGIYVLIGAVTRHAGMMTPLAFLLAAIVMGLTVASYAELCTRFPVAAGEAAYVRAAFGRRWVSTLTGLIMIGTGVIASATVAIGSAGYIGQFTDLPRPMVITAVIITVAIVVAWGVLESVLLASIFTVVEVGGLLLIIAAAWRADLGIIPALTAWPSFEFAQWNGLLFASLLAFFAFTGFEDLTNMIEEAHVPERNVPTAMALTLGITTFLYVVIAAIAVTAISPKELAGSSAPLSLVFGRVAGMSAIAISLIAIVSTLNTIIAQMTMSIRVVYGLAKQGDLPAKFGQVHVKTATPLLATGIIMLLTLGFALIVPFERLAEWTSVATLVVFALVNLALIKIRVAEKRPSRAIIHVPLVIPVLGLTTCIVMICTAVT